MASGISSCMPIVMRLVGDAIGKDSQNRLQEAYCQYLSCCIYISQILKDDAWEKDLPEVYNRDTAKLFKLIQQCQERALSIVSSQASQSFSPPNSPSLDTRKQFSNNTQSNTANPSLEPPNQNVRKYSDPIPPRLTQDSNPPWRGHTRNNSAGSIPAGQSPARSLKFPSPPSSPPATTNRRATVSGPGDASLRNNQPLITAYRARMDQGSTGAIQRGPNRETITKSLSLMRKMAENRQIAKAREDAIKKKIMERQMRLQEEANRRFASATVASREEQEQRNLYTRILEYEQDMVWPKQLRESLRRLPENSKLINEIIKKIFSSKDHPLTCYFLQYQYLVYHSLIPLVYDSRFMSEKADEMSEKHGYADRNESDRQSMDEGIPKPGQGQSEGESSLEEQEEKDKGQLGHGETGGESSLDGDPALGGDSSKEDDTFGAMSFSALKKKESELDDGIQSDSETSDADGENNGLSKSEKDNYPSDKGDGPSESEQLDTVIDRNAENTECTINSNEAQVSDTSDTHFTVRENEDGIAVDSEGDSGELSPKLDFKAEPCEEGAASTILNNQNDTENNIDDVNIIRGGDFNEALGTELEQEGGKLPSTENNEEITSEDDDAETVEESRSDSNKNVVSTGPDKQSDIDDDKCTEVVKTEERDSEQHLDLMGNTNGDVESISNESDDDSNATEKSELTDVDAEEAAAVHGTSENVADSLDVKEKSEAMDEELFVVDRDVDNREKDMESGEKESRDLHNEGEPEQDTTGENSEPTGERLDEIRSLLDKEGSTDRERDAANTDDREIQRENKPEIVRKPFDLESDFLELEEEMLGWESSDGEDEIEVDRKEEEKHECENRETLDRSKDVMNVAEATGELPQEDHGEEIPVDDHGDISNELHSPNTAPPSGSGGEVASGGGDVCTDDGESSSSSRAVTPGDADSEVCTSNDTGTGEGSGRTHGKASLPPEVCLEETKKHLRDIFVDIRFFLEKLQKLLILAYEELDTPTGCDQCYASVEHPFFQPLWPLLLAVLRRVNYEKEVTLGCVMTKRIRDGPAEMGVTERLCMTDKVALEAIGNHYPYQLAVEELHKVMTYVCPLEKLECVVRTSRGICQSVEDYWESKGKPRHCSETSIGCDDLLPILSYVIIRNGMAQLVSECHAMEEFIPEGYLMGEEGYCLTTLQTALAYLATLDTDTSN